MLNLRQYSQESFVQTLIDTSKSFFSEVKPLAGYITNHSKTLLRAGTSGGLRGNMIDKNTKDVVEPAAYKLP